MEPFDLEHLARQAEAALADGQHVRALAMLDQLLADRSDQPTLHFWRSRALLEAGDCAEALEAARQAVSLDPYLVDAYLPLAWAAVGVNRKQEAQEAFERALAVSGRDVAWLVEYATFLASQRGPKLGEEIAREAIAARPDSPDAWAALGFAQYRMHRLREAEESFREALLRQPDHPRAMIYMSRLLNRTGRPDRAAALAELLEDNPDAAGIALKLQLEAIKHMDMLGAPSDAADRPADRPEAPARPAFDWGHFARTYVRAAGWAVGIGVTATCMILAAVTRGRALYPFLAVAGIALIGAMVMTRQR